MNQKHYLLNILFGCVVLVSTHKTANAQITPDNTLGAEASQLTPNVLINGANADRIDGGAIRGINLFHSFSEFNIDDGQRVYFGNPSLVENIFSRITGNSASNIFGTLGVDGNANLFFMNPNGILFGENASLDVGGSFVGTTANQVGFGEQGVFSASDPEAPPLLTIEPNLLRFNRFNRNAAIQNNGNLQVPIGRSLALVGSNVNLDGGGLFAPGGRVELGGLREAGAVDLRIDGDIFSLSFPNGVQRGDISLTNRSRVDTLADDGGSIAVNARNVEISGGSLIIAGIGQGLGTIDSQAGDIKVKATNLVNIEQSSVIGNTVSSNAIGNSGDIFIDTVSLSLNNAGQLSTTINGKGNGGNIIINAQDKISFDGTTSDGKFYSGVVSLVKEKAEGKSGDIDIKANLLSVTNGAAIASITGGKGDAGNITINTNSQVIFNGKSKNGSLVSSLSSAVAENAIGKGGDIHITTNELSFANEAFLSSSSLGKGNAGNLIIDVRDRVLFDDSSIFSNIDNNAQGKGGDIFINTGSLSVTNGTLIGASTLGKGDAGNVIINARGRVSFDGRSPDGNFRSAATSSVGDKNAEGKGGDIRITAKELFVTNGAGLDAGTYGNGDAGNIIIDVRGQTYFDDGDALSFVRPEAKGKGGDIHITTDDIYIINGSQFAASTLGEGKAGNIKIKANRNANISGFSSSNQRSSGLFTFSTNNSTGEVGNINLDAKIFQLSDGAVLDARTRNNFKGGDIEINVSVFEALNGGQLITNTSGSGNAGRIIVNATNLITIDGRDINFNDRVAKSSERVPNIGSVSGLFVRSSRSGTTGDIKITSPKITLDNQGILNAESTSGNGGNINLISDLLLMRRQAQISTNAGTAQQSGDGGNININSTFVTAIPGENSDITTNSFAGKGGRIDVTAQGIFGLEIRDRLTPLSDITAFSELSPTFNGEIILNTPNVDPSQGTIELPQTIIDPDALIAQNPCLQRGGSEFIVTGKGGLPVNPNQMLNADAVEIDLVETAPLTTIEKQALNNNLNDILNKNNVSINNKILPARGWVVRGDEVILTAYAANGKQIRRQEDNFSACRTK